LQLQGFISSHTVSVSRKAVFPDVSDNDKKVRSKVTRILRKMKAFGLILKFLHSLGAKFLQRE